MICPYLMKSETFIETWQQAPNESETVTDGVTFRTVTHEYAECLKNDCGAYCDGKSNYNSKE